MNWRLIIGDQTKHTLKYTDDYLEYIYTYEIKIYHRTR